MVNPEEIKREISKVKNKKGKDGKGFQMSMAEFAKYYAMSLVVKVLVHMCVGDSL